MASNKVTVRIWMPTDMGLKGGIASLVGVGHASLTVRHNDKKHYITWRANGSPFESFEMEADPYIDTFRKQHDKKSMKGFLNTYEPTYKIRLKTKQNTQDEGLDSGLIVAFWEDRLAHKPKYSFLSKTENCTGCVAAALHAGGMDQYVPAPNIWFVQDAGDLLAWVLKAEKRLGEVLSEKDEI